MKVDYHIHLEEGPYSLSFVEKTLKALAHFDSENQEEKIHSKKWLEKSMEIMKRSLDEGEYSKWWLDFYLQEALNKGINRSRNCRSFISVSGNERLLHKIYGCYIK